MQKVVREEAMVSEVIDDCVKIVIKRHASCESCNACGLGTKSEITMVIPNKLGAVRGDRVLLVMPVGRMYQAAFLVYTLPLGMLFVGYFSAAAAGKMCGLSGELGEMPGILGGFIAMGLTYYGIHLWDRFRKIGDCFQPELKAIIPLSEEETLLSVQ